jgi:hypothetical protein
VKTALVVSSITVLALGGLALAQSENSFQGRSETGEILHILPPPAALHSPHATGPTFASPSQETQVYSASYGSGSLVNHGGGVMTNAGFWAIYWNSGVAGSTQTSINPATGVKFAKLSDQIDAFVNSFGSNAPYSASPTDDFSIVQQYGPAIVSTVHNWGAYVDNKAEKASISDASIRSYLAGLFSAGKVQAAGNIIYGVYLPAKMKVTMSGGASCSSFCGYHGSFSYGGVQIKYAVFPYLNCAACSLSGLTVADMLTIVGSHEIREAVTDPNLNAWYDASGYEADDKCAWHNLYKTNGGFMVQPEYSNGGGTQAGGSGPYPGPGCVVPNR